jgi:hypothetical protein
MSSFLNPNYFQAILNLIQGRHVSEYDLNAVDFAFFFFSQQLLPFGECSGKHFMQWLAVLSERQF